MHAGAKAAGKLQVDFIDLKLLSLLKKLPGWGIAQCEECIKF